MSQLIGLIRRIEKIKWRVLSKDFQLLKKRLKQQLKSLWRQDQHQRRTQWILLMRSSCNLKNLKIKRKNHKICTMTYRIINFRYKNLSLSRLMMIFWSKDQRKSQRRKGLKNHFFSFERKDYPRKKAWYAKKCKQTFIPNIITYQYTNRNSSFSDWMSQSI